VAWHGHGYVEGRNLEVEYGWAEGDENRLKQLMADLVRRRLALIAATGGIRSAQVARDATSSIPVLFISGTNPVQIGLVASMSRPGRNLTGVSLDSSDLVPKRLEVLRDGKLLPEGAKIALLASSGPYAPASEEKFAREQGLIIIKVNRQNELAREFTAAVEQGARALLVSADPLYFNARDLIVELAARHGLPAVYPGREYALAGGLMSYGPSIPDAYRKIGIYAGLILKGAKPQDLPVVSSQTWDLVINLKTAAALGVTIVPELIARANETIK
jgi:putative ABC transport system substrate-binding protein